MRYDEALPTLVRAAQEAGLDLTSDDFLVLRDSAGRLGIASRHRLNHPALLGRLRKELAAYALPEPLLPKALHESLKALQPKRHFLHTAAGSIEGLWLVERQIVGADWLSEPSPAPLGPPRLVFGSLKGGVGRTTALTVLAAALAEKGKKVLCIDLDLEAPGLGSMLLQNNGNEDRRPKYGALDYLVEDGKDPIYDDEMLDFVGISHFYSSRIHVLPAVGRKTEQDYPENMIGKLARGLIEDVGPDGRWSVAQQLRRMVDRFVAQGDYDAVLIDARAGLAELTASTWLGLGAKKLVLFGNNHPQTFSGYRYVLAHLRNSAGILAADSPNDWRQRLSFVQSKAPSTFSARNPFRERLHELCTEQLYEQELSAGDEMAFNFALDECGDDIPHDAGYIVYHPEFDVFSPLDDHTVLSGEVYGGPFGAFLNRMFCLLGMESSS